MASKIATKKRIEQKTDFPNNISAGVNNFKIQNLEKSVFNE